MVQESEEPNREEKAQQDLGRICPLGGRPFPRLLTLPGSSTTQVLFTSASVSLPHLGKESFFGRAHSMRKFQGQEWNPLSHQGTPCLLCLHHQIPPCLQRPTLFHEFFPIGNNFPQSFLDRIYHFLFCISLYRVYMTLCHVFCIPDYNLLTSLNIPCQQRQTQRIKHIWQGLSPDL